jgi:hypothetical protein
MYNVKTAVKRHKKKLIEGSILSVKFIFTIHNIET